MTDRITLPRVTVEQALSLCESVQGLRTDDEDGSTVWCQELIEALRAALVQAEPVQTDTCTWWQDGDSDSDTYQTSCGKYFAITDGTPEDNKMRHCCYCGKKLAQELIEEDGGE